MGAEAMFRNAGLESCARWSPEKLNAADLGFVGGTTCEGDDNIAIGIRSEGREVRHNGLIFSGLGGDVVIGEDAPAVDIHVELALARSQLEFGKVKSDRVSFSLVHLDSVSAPPPALGLVHRRGRGIGDG